MQNKIKKNYSAIQLFSYSAENGFTLLEAIVAIFILLVGTTGAMTLISRGIVGLNVSRENLIATNLAQEGLEIIHNIRDTNWLEGVAWNDWYDGDGIADNCSLPTEPPTCEGYVLWDSSNLEGNDGLELKWNSATNRYDRYDANGAEGKSFSRKITIYDNNDPDTSIIQSTVGWGGEGSCISGGISINRKYCLTLQERLYNWR